MVPNRLTVQVLLTDKASHQVISMFIRRSLHGFPEELRMYGLVIVVIEQFDSRQPHPRAQSRLKLLQIII